MSHEAQIAFNTEMAKVLKRLKKDAGAKSIRQNYRGTGSQKHVRQLWCRFANGCVIDIWIQTSSIKLGGVVLSRPPSVEGGGFPNGRIAYEGREPEAIYGDVLAALRTWMGI